MTTITACHRAAPSAPPPTPVTDATRAESWSRQFGSANHEEGTGVVADANGNVYVAGWTDGALAGQGSSGGNAFVVKYDSQGTRMWTRQLGTTGKDMARGVTVDARGNLYLTGDVSGALDGQTAHGHEDLFVAKLDENGTALWTRQLGGAETDVGQSVSADANGNVYVAGYTHSALDGQTAAGLSDALLVKYDATGEKHWLRLLGTTEWDRGLGVAADAMANVYVVGETSGALDGGVAAGHYDVFVAKYNAAGTMLWTRQLGTSETDRGLGVATDASGAVYVTGTTDGTFDGETSAGDKDLFVAKYDPDGVKQWTRQLGTQGLDEGAAVATDATGNVYVTGWTDGALDGQPSIGSADVFVVKCDRDGVRLWTRQFGTVKRDTGSALTTDARGAVYLAGTTDGAFDGQTSAGGRDVFVVKYDRDGNHR